MSPPRRPARNADEVQHLLGDPAAPRADPGAAVRRGARADGQRRPARLRRLRGRRALLLPEVLDLDEPDGLLRSGGAADEEHPLPDDAARPALPQPAGAGLGDRRHRHPHRRPLRVGRGPRPRLDPDQGRRPPRRARPPELRGGGRPALRGARQRALLAPGRVLPGRGLAHRPVPEAEVQDLPRRHLRPHLRARRRARLGCRRAAAAALRRARSSSSISTAPSAQSTARPRHRLDPRLPPRRGPRDRAARGARLGHAASSRATARR